MNSRAILILIAIATGFAFHHCYHSSFCHQKNHARCGLGLIPLYGIVTYFLYQMIGNSSVKTPHRFVASVNASVSDQTFHDCNDCRGIFFSRSTRKKGTRAGRHGYLCSVYHCVDLGFYFLLRREINNSECHRKKKSYVVAGLMSGTSLDGLDVAIRRFTKNNKWNYEILAAKTFDYGHELKLKLSEAHLLSGEKLMRLHSDLGMLHGEWVHDFILNHKIEIDFIASHGHTVFHQPEKGFTLQIASRNISLPLLEYPWLQTFAHLM